MRLGVVWEEATNAHYRAMDPMKAMARRGHEVVWPQDEVPDVRQLATCDVVHVYRLCTLDIHRMLGELVEGGTPITYDNDDDFTTVPKGTKMHKRFGGLKGYEVHASTVKMARLAHCFTTTNERLAERYRRAGVPRVEVIPNYVATDVKRPTNRHPGVVIGWIAAMEHKADAEQLGIADALRRLVDKYPDVRVECIGVNLGLPERYRHDLSVPFRQLPRRIGGFDIGLAPLADLPVNRMRSDIKVKEYAASGVPWLASPIGPYAYLGEAQGGRLVPDGGWFDALDRLVTNRRERRRLARNARKWAKGQTIDAAGERWEQVFADAAANAGASVPARAAR